MRKRRESKDVYKFWERHIWKLCSFIQTNIKNWGRLDIYFDGCFIDKTQDFAENRNNILEGVRRTCKDFSASGNQYSSGTDVP